MPDDSRGFFERIGDALRNAFTDSGSVPETFTPAPRTPERTAATEPSDVDFNDHGPYPAQWGADERELWDNEPNTARDLYDDSEWEDLQRSFHFGWLATGLSKSEHEQARNEFYGLSGVDPSSFDWEAFREYWADHDSPGVAA